MARRIYVLKICQYYLCPYRKDRSVYGQHGVVSAGRTFTSTCMDRSVVGSHGSAELRMIRADGED